MSFLDVKANCVFFTRRTPILLDVSNIELFVKRFMILSRAFSLRTGGEKFYVSYVRISGFRVVAHLMLLYNTAIVIQFSCDAALL